MASLAWKRVFVYSPRPPFLATFCHQERIQVMPLTIPEGWSKPRAFYDANKIDFHLCGIMFWFMGGRVSDV